MRRRVWRAAVTGLCLAAALVRPAAGQQEVERENLAGIRDVNVVVADRADDVEAAWLTRRGLLATVEQEAIDIYRQEQETAPQHGSAG